MPARRERAAAPGANCGREVMTPLATVDQRAVVLRRATEADTTAIAAIWNDAVSHGDATTELEPRTPAAQREWLACHGETHPVIVAESRDEVVAWGALSPYRPRPAFAASVEDSVYVKAGHRGRGLGALILGELVALARRAHEHRRAATAARGVADEVGQPGAHGLADEVLLGHRHRAGHPAVADRAQQRRDHLGEHRVDAVERERLVEPQRDLGDVAAVDRSEDHLDVLAGRRRGRRRRRPEQERRLADAVALRKPCAQPLHARDVAFGIATLAARGALRPKDPITLFPLPQRVRCNPGPLCERGDVESPRQCSSFRPAS
jgi:phosphinothricin acetyltransferase